MSLVFMALRATSATLRAGLTNRAIPARYLSLSTPFRDEEEAEAETIEKKPIDPLKDRTKVIPVETSIQYLQSSAYKETYGSDPVWKMYRRNHKGQLPPKKTRKTCIRSGVISTGNPCPICRDEYLVLDHRNIALLKQFISEHDGTVLSYQKTGICQKKYLELLVVVERAKDYGTIAYDLPIRYYDYSQWYTPEQPKN